MAIAKDYYAYLVANAKQAAALKKRALDMALAAMTTAQFDKSGKFIGYAKTKEGAPKMGTIDVAHEEAKKNIQASGEAAGMLRSGQQAERLSGEEADWRSRIISAKQDTANKKIGATTSLAEQLAGYQATYGNSGGSGGSSGSTNPQLKTATSWTPYDTGAIGAGAPAPVTTFPNTWWPSLPQKPKK